ncbi:MAG: AraC family transcriptional regulator [Clostridia bacterium]|nr:AraC family transcriptional regulator [Clostridia bacterium]
MFFDNELQFLQKMLRKCNVQSYIIDPNEPIDELISRELRQVFPEQSHGQTFFDYITGVRQATVYRLSDAFWCRYIFFELPYCEKTTVFIAGPYLNININRQQILELTERLSLPPQIYRELETFYGSIPVIREENHLFAMINTIAEYIWNGEDNFDIVDLSFDRDIAFLSNFAHPKPTADNPMPDIQIMEQRYRFENDLMNAVSQGNSKKAELMMSRISELSFEIRTADQLRNMKNYCIIMNTLMRKSAEKGKVHPVHLDSVSSDFARRIEAIRSLNEVKHFMMEMMQSYCSLVKHHSMKNYSSLVQNTIIYIENDLTGDLTLSTIAHHNNVSAGYLSGLFKKETGQTVTEYVNGKRIAFAKHLLKTTNLQIQTIAQHCGILDFHYFCRLFKNFTGKTPTEYRNRYTID